MAIGLANWLKMVVTYTVKFWCTLMHNCTLLVNTTHHHCETFCSDSIGKDFQCVGNQHGGVRNVVKEIIEEDQRNRRYNCVEPSSFTVSIYGTHLWLQLSCGRRWKVLPWRSTDQRLNICQSFLRCHESKFQPILTYQHPRVRYNEQCSATDQINKHGRRQPD